MNEDEAVPLPPETFVVPRHRVLNARRGLPRPPFFWTLDQVATMLGITESLLLASYVWRVGKDKGRYDLSLLRAVNINPQAERSEFRVSDGEFVRWLHHMDLWIYDPAAQLADHLPQTTITTQLRGVRLPREKPHDIHPNDETPDPRLLDL
jgi:hypothetical protein